MEKKIKPELIAVGDPQVIVADLQPFDKAKEQVGLTVAELEQHLVINTKGELDEAMEVLSIASKVEKAIEKKRKELVAPFNNGAKDINDYVKTVTTGLPAAIQKVKDAVLLFQRNEEERAFELTKQARIKQLEDMGFTWDAKLEKYMNGNVDFSPTYFKWEDKSWGGVISATVMELQEQEAAKIQALQEGDPELAELLGYNEESPEPIAILPAPSVKLYEPEKLKGSAKVWKFEITDAEAVPREYLVVDETAIRKAVGAGVREIPGVRIYQDDILRVR